MEYDDDDDIFKQECVMVIVQDCIANNSFRRIHLCGMVTCRVDIHFSCNNKHMAVCKSILHSCVMCMSVDLILYYLLMIYIIFAFAFQKSCVKLFG
jgi:hypothetical protein